MVFYTLRKSAFKTKLHVLNYLGINYPCLQEKMPLMTSDTFSGFFYQAGLVSPAISWILQPGRFPTRTGLLYAITFLVVLASISIVS
jgi:hypothetical protein